MAAAQICARIARVELWPEFEGYGILPGIEAASYERRTAEMTGSRIAVRNRDGSTHVEEITEWSPGVRVTMRMQEFSPPLRSLADHFVEQWDFTEDSSGTRIRRSFSLYPRSALTRVPLWLISRLLQRAVARHLRQMQSSADVR